MPTAFVAHCTSSAIRQRHQLDEVELATSVVGRWAFLSLPAVWLSHMRTMSL
jgi:hypothetical protein